VADLEVVGVLGELWSGEFDCGDELVGLERGVTLWGGAGKTVEVGDCDGAFALGAGDVDGGVEGGEGYVHVGGVGGDTAFVRTEDSVDTVSALDGGTSAPRFALVAGGEGGVNELIAPGALEEVAAGGGHVTKRRGGSAQECLREER